MSVQATTRLGDHVVTIYVNEQPYHSTGWPTFEIATNEAKRVALALGLTGCTTNPADAPSIQPERTRIPTGVYYNSATDNFYDRATRHGKGNGFYAAWNTRREEFPTVAYSDMPDVD